MIVQELITKWGFKADASSLTKVKKGVSGLTSSLAVLTGVASSVVVGVGAIVNNATNFADELIKTSQSVGIGTEALQKLRYASGLAGVGQDELRMGVMRFSRAVLEARQGVETYTKVFSRLGINTAQLQDKTKDADEFIAIIADRFKAMPDGIEKTATAMELFGRSGAKLIPLLNTGSSGIRELYKEADELGIILDKDVLVASEEFRDNLERIGYVVSNLKNRIGLALMPKLQELITGWLDWYKANKDLVNQKIDRIIVNLSKAFKASISIIKTVLGLLKGFSNAVGGVERAIKLLAGAWALFMGAKVVLSIASIVIGLKGLISTMTIAGNAGALMWAKILAPIAILAGLGVGAYKLGQWLGDKSNNNSSVMGNMSTPAPVSNNKSSMQNNIKVEVKSNGNESPEQMGVKIGESIEDYLIKNLDPVVGGE